MSYIGKYCMIRTRDAGVFTGVVVSRDKDEVVLSGSRWIWYWDGAATLAQLAMEGTKTPEDCRFPCEIDEQLLLGVVQIIPMSEQARLSIASVPVWER